jgi:NADP-dependent aldehyde dehydrogenase
MLTAGIYRAFEDGIARLSAHPKVEPVARGLKPEGGSCGQAALFGVRAPDLLTEEGLTDEVFGASSMVVRCADPAEMLAVLRGLEGQLTATLHFDPEDEPEVAEMIPALEALAGRLLCNGWPTGVEVAHAMVHGGPFPATSDGRSTSVGTLAIDRFLRPVCYQSFPQSLLPPELRDGAQAGVPHRLDGVFHAA